MKKLVVLVLLVLGMAIAATSDRYTLRLGPLELAQLSPDHGTILAHSTRFLQDIQYKDFEHAATFHAAEDAKDRNIAQKLEAKFAVKPELIDIRHFEILRIDIFPDGGRAKAITNVSAKLLNVGQERDAELVLYWKKKGDGWFMDLQSSL